MQNNEENNEEGGGLAGRKSETMPSTSKDRTVCLSRMLLRTLDIPSGHPQPLAVPLAQTLTMQQKRSGIMWASLLCGVNRFPSLRRAAMRQIGKWHGCDRHGTLCARGVRRARSVRHLRGLHERLCGDATATRYPDSREEQRATILREGSGHNGSLSRWEACRQSQGGAVVGLAELLGRW